MRRAMFVESLASWFQQGGAAVAGGRQALLSL